MVNIIFKYTLIAFLSFISLGIFSQTTIVNWNFPNNPDDAIADGGIAANNAKTISTVGGTSVVDFAAGGATTNAANASGWDSGNGLKYWQIDFVTTGFTNITVSSAQRSSNTGPRDFRLEYKVGAGAWTLVTGGTIVVAGNFTSGVLTNLALPAACDGQTQVFVRWIMTSNTAVGGAAVTSAGTSRIDNIVIQGSCTASAPSCATYSAPANGGTGCPSGETLSWNALAAPSCGSITYDVYFNSGTTATTLASPGQAGTTYATGALIAGTTYAWKIVPKNGATSASGCSTFTFVANNVTPSCATYISPANGLSFCPVSQTLSWNAVATTCGSILYDVYFNAGTTATTVVSSGQAGTTYPTGALSPSTTYAWKIVPSNGGVSSSGCSTFTFVTNATSGSNAPLTENFESCNDWTLVNGAQTNIWAIGTATNNGGSQSIYISNNSGTSNAYSNTTSRVHFYKDITFPAGQSCINLSFDWKSNGESNFDFLAVYAIATSSTPVAGTAITSGQLGGNLQLQTTWQSASISLPSAYAGTTQRLVFSWVNDNGTRNQAPAAIDNIVITAGGAPTPACATYSAPINGASVCGSQTLSWNALAAPTCGSITYDVYFNAGTTATAVVSAAQAGTTYVTGALSNGTYAWKVVPSNGTVTATGCTDYTFTVSSSPLPSCATYSAPSNGASICGSSQTLSWNAVASGGCGTIAYDVYFNPGISATTLVSAAQSGTTYATGSLSGGTTYAWKIVPVNGTVTATGCTDYTFTAGGPINDLPCNAIDIPIGTVASGDNTCADNTSEPATPSCWGAGTRHTVWYSFTAPATGNVKIRTAPGTLLNTQIAVYSGACGVGMTTVTAGCNRNAANCGLNPVLLSELSLTGLTSGTTYYIAVDGETSLVGTFAITVINSTSSYPTTSGQDCSTPNTICTPTVLVGDPGNQGIGFTCDDPGGASNCTGGERGSVWYQITIASTGNLNFVITPNDYTGTYHIETDYDFIMWKVGGAGATSCAAIASGTPVPVVCNYSSIGFGGVYTGGNAPAGSNASYNANFEPTISATAGETYLLLIENFSGSTKGFALDFSSSGAAVVNYSTSTTVAWTGGANTDVWNSATNWGACNLPACGVDAVVSTISTHQPLITSAMGTVAVNNFTVDPGAILTLGPNSVLKVCGNLTNNGTISADATSTILFSDDATHTLNGTLSGSSTLGNLVITDAAGGANCTVIANSNIELKGSFTTSNTTSIFNLNSKNLSIAGNLINSAGASTFSNTTGSTITFKGTSAQTYNPNANSATPTLTLNNVVINHTGTGVTLSTANTPNMVLGTSGILTLTSGKIITPNNQEVTLMNTALAAVGAGSANSYVEGNLRRYLSAGALGLYNFPVGHATPGYERATVDFKTAAAAGAIQLVARFDPWGGAWAQPSAPNWSECSAIYDAAYLNNGYWSIDASSPSTGSYDLTLYNRGYSNASVVYSIGKSPSSAPSWTLNGTCVSGTPISAVQRTGMSGFSKMATVQGHASNLPVQLVSFSGVSEGSYNSINWKSAVEVNFRHYELESSEDGINFEKITTVNPIGNPSSLNNYNYIDFNSYNPITYYRLKIVDLDYTFEYSSTISVENGINKTKTVTVYPNPASTELFIKLVAPSEKEALINIKDIYGRIIYEQKINLNQGIDNTYINTSNFATGTYIVSITAGNSLSENIKVVISKN